jgi:hypothetical protein
MTTCNESLASAISGSEQTPAEVVGEDRAELDRLIESLSADSPQLREATDEEVIPLYLIISSRDGLTGKYGLRGFNYLDNDLYEFKQVVEDQTGLEAMTIYVDDGPSVMPYGLRHVDPTNPWQIKMLVDNLDARLNEQGKGIRYILIVGGDSIIPFHRLPNPIDDQDTDVPSDNPYASRDADYLIPERAVGRMPDSEGEGVGFLHALIQTAIDGHQRQATSGKGILSAIFRTFRPADDGQRNGHGLGYSASIWRKASRVVFEVIGDNRHLRTSPPVTYQEFGIAEPPHFSYFNLHGIEDGPNWYGQRDSLFPADYPLFPVALRPQDLTAGEHADSVVCTEACYGANILGKDIESSIALRFLASQALALVGSTSVSYGAIAPPLLGADLISKYFWEGLQAYLTVGEALKYAKVNLAKEMQDQQGYLDGEDQKTLISFVLYGDPSLPGSAVRGGLAMSVASKTFCPPIICQKKAKQQKGPVSDELIATVKSRVEVGLPHMAQAQVHAVPLAFCSGECDNRCCPTRGTGKAAKKGYAGNWTLTLEKDIPVTGDGAHHQVVQVTVDNGGHILKLAVSK